MDTQTGEVMAREDLLKNMGQREFDIRAVEIDVKNLSRRARRKLNADGHVVITGRSRCPCGSGKRFKSLLHDCSQKMSDYRMTLTTPRKPDWEGVVRGKGRESVQNACNKVHTYPNVYLNTAHGTGPLYRMTLTRLMGEEAAEFGKARE